MISNKIIDHFYGLVGQISSGLPLLMITSIISKNIGIEEAGNFVILVAIISTLFTISLWGLRPMIIIDNYQSFRKQDYIYFQCIFFYLTYTDNCLICSSQRYKTHSTFLSFFYTKYLMGLLT